MQSFSCIFVCDFVAAFGAGCEVDGVVELGSWVDGMLLDEGVDWAGAGVCAATMPPVSKAIKANPPAARFMAVLRYLASEV
jgi:hypothetical protein